MILIVLVKIVCFNVCWLNFVLIDVEYIFFKLIGSVFVFNKDESCFVFLIVKFLFMIDILVWLNIWFIVVVDKNFGFGFVDFVLYEFFFFLKLS